MADTVVLFHAHPDDESLLTAGTMARAAAEGHRVVLVVATAGEEGEAADAYRASGPGALGDVRQAELRRSAEILGVHRVEVLGYRDSGSEATPTTPAGPDATGTGEAAATGDGGGPVPFSAAPVDEAAGRLAAILTEEDAAVLTVYDRNGGYGHPDHRQVHAVGHAAAARAGTPVVLEATFDRDLLRQGIELAGALGYALPPEFSPETFDHWFTPAAEITHAVDVSAHLAAKRASMASHASQATSASGAPRSLAQFLALPDEYFALAFGTEWYVQRGRQPGQRVGDIFATVPAAEADDRQNTLS